MLCRGRLARRVPGREPGADVDAAAAASRAASTISSSRWRSCAPGRSRATWCTPTCAGATGSEPVDLSLRGAGGGAATRRSACRCSRSRRCRSPSSRRASRPTRPTSCAAPWPPSATSAPSTPSARSSSPAWSATATSASSPSAASARSRASASTASPRATRRASRCSSTSRPGSSATIPDVFCAAILNSQPMGFYQPAQLVRDAREHGVEVRQPDINASDWDCTLELPSRLVPGIQAQQGLQERVARGGDANVWISGYPGSLGRSSEGSANQKMRGAARAAPRRRPDGKATRRPFSRRAGRAMPTCRRCGRAAALRSACLERLADADAFRSIGLDRRAALWAVKGLDGGALHGGDTSQGARPPPTPRS